MKQKTISQRSIFVFQLSWLISLPIYTTLTHGTILNDFIKHKPTSWKNIFHFPTIRRISLNHSTRNSPVELERFPILFQFLPIPFNRHLSSRNCLAKVERSSISSFFFLLDFPFNLSIAVQVHKTTSLPTQLAYITTTYIRQQTRQR